MYDIHVGSCTRHTSPGVKRPGTFSGVIERIPYLKLLGITDFELVPVMAVDEQDAPGVTAVRRLKKYRGHSTHSFLSPHPGYCVWPEKVTHVQQFRDMVKALDMKGMGVMLDVVPNHTVFITLTSPGFGDIVPVHPIARMLVILEGVTGQPSPVILTAWLV